MTRNFDSKKESLFAQFPSETWITSTTISEILPGYSACTQAKFIQKMKEKSRSEDDEFIKLISQILDIGVKKAESIVKAALKKQPAFR